MSIINFDHWVKRTTDIHDHGYTQITEKHNINIYLFSFKWSNAIVWTKYVGYWHKGD